MAEPHGAIRVAFVTTVGSPPSSTTFGRTGSSAGVTYGPVPPWHGAVECCDFRIRLVRPQHRHYNVMYGSVGAGIALLVWMYLMSAIALLGCEFNANTSARWPNAPPDRGDYQPRRGQRKAPRARAIFAADEDGVD